MPLLLSTFIKNNPDWEQQLAKPPYFIKIKRGDGFVLFKYDQIHSDFTLPLVRECRGIILDESDAYKPVCVPFFKFGNFGESYVPDIDWDTACVQEKVDGSLIKLWHCRGEWHVSSNGEIDAQNAHVHSALLKRKTNLHKLFMEAWDETGVTMEDLEKNYTYMFELTSPHNRIVVSYEGVSIRHIGTRDNQTLLECDIDIGILKPRVFALKTLEDCINSAKEMGADEEGYVVVDKHYHRVKVKSPLYVTLNHMAQGTTTLTRVIEIIQKNEQDELLSYFPEYRDVFNEISGQMRSFCARQDADAAMLQGKTFESRKELAAMVTKMECPSCLFALMDKKAENAWAWLISRMPEKVLEMIGGGEVE